MISLVVGQSISGTVEKLVFGGAGLMRYEGVVIFIHGVLPNEKIVCTITAVHARYAEATLSRIIEASEDRIVCRCRHYGRCGGCQLQHVRHDLHAAVKKTWLSDALYRSPPESPVEFVPAKEMWKWRHVVILHARWEEAWICGYVGYDGKLFNVVECPIFVTKEECCFLRVRELVDMLPGRKGEEVEVRIIRLDEGFALKIEGTKALGRKTRQALCERVSSWPFVKACLFQFPGWKHLCGAEQLSLTIFGSSWFFSVHSFLQANLLQSERVWQDVFDRIRADGKKHTVMDLYSGVGVTAIMLALYGHEVTAVEMSPEAVEAARLSAELKKVSLRLICSGVEEALSREKFVADWWIVNPPRMGLSAKAIQLLVASRPRQLLYVSCSPTTLARDLRILAGEKWKITSVRGYDMFPQTTHLESLATLEYTS